MSHHEIIITVTSMSGAPLGEDAFRSLAHRRERAIAQLAREAGYEDIELAMHKIKITEIARSDERVRELIELDT
jgi:hypothetical protein